MISRTAEYALRAVVNLAEAGGGPATAREISENIGVSAGYLAKVLRTLSHADLVLAQRGVGGGFTLAKDPGDITILEVLEACDGYTGPILRCPVGKHNELCALHQLLNSTTEMIGRAFGETTIADVANPGHNGSVHAETAAQSR